MNPYVTMNAGVSVDRKMQTFTALAMVTIMMMTLSAWSCPFGSTQSWLTLIQNDLPLLETQATSIIAIADPADLALAQAVSKGVSVGVKLVADAYAAYKLNPNAATLQNVAAALDKAAADLPAVLSGITFSDPIVGLAITAAVTAIVGTLDIIAANIPAAAQTPAIKTARAKRMKMSLNSTESKKALAPTSVKAAWNAKVCDPYPSLTRCPRM